MSKKRVLILGAGLAGLSTAWHLKKKGLDCYIFEAEPEIGGMCRSKKIDGFTFDYCGHLLHFKHSYVFNMVNSLLGGNLAVNVRDAQVYFRGRYIRYPFQANLYGLPAGIIKECLLGFLKNASVGKCIKKKDVNFLDWINNTFGSGIAKHFMIPYNNKFWTIAVNRITSQWVDDFVPVPSLSEVVEGTVEEKFRQFGYNARFWYPKKGGIDQLPKALASSLENIYTDSKVSEIDCRKGSIKISPKETLGFDYLVSTVPLPTMINLIKNPPSSVRNALRRLRWNSIFNLNLGTGKKHDLKHHWIYYPQKETSFFRVGFHHNFSGNLAPSAKGSLYIEVSYSKNRPINKSRIVDRIKDDLRKFGVLPQNNGICLTDVNDIKYGYPIYDYYYNHSRNTILSYLSSKNIFCCGRYGSWRYFSMEDSIMDGKKTAEYIIDNVQRKI